MLKNVAGQFVGVQMVSASDGTAFSGTVTVYVTVDNGTQTIGSVGNGVCTHKGNGLHNYAPSQAETNGNSIQFTFIGTGAIPQTIQLETLPTTGVLAPTVANRTLDVSAGGEAGIDLANVGSPTATLNLSGTTIKTATDVETDTQDIQTRIPAALDGGRIAAVLDSAITAQITAIETFATRITTGIVQDGAVWQFTANMLELGPANAGGGDATLAKQNEILAAIQGTEVIQVASPNVNGNLVLTQGDDYDGTANPRAQWTVTTDYTDGWAVTLTIRDADDAVVYTTSGTVVSATVIAVTIAAPTGLTMTGCPGQWQGKFDVQLTKAGKKKTIALGVCYINEDQTR